MSSDITITNALKNQVQNLAKGKTGTAESKGAAPHAPAASGLMPEDTTLILNTIQSQTRDLQSLLDTLENSLSNLQQYKSAAQSVISALEEAGGYTVTARNILSGDQNAETADMLGELEKKFSATLAKIDGIVKNAATDGANLLAGDTLKTMIGSDERNAVQTIGLPLTVEGLGIRKPDFSSLKTVQDSRIDVINALDIATAMRNNIAADADTLKTRYDFSQSTIETMASAAKTLPGTSLNDEAAQLLALQIRQQLSETDMPLAGEAQQNLLRQFLS